MSGFKSLEALAFTCPRLGVFMKLSIFRATGGACLMALIYGCVRISERFYSVIMLACSP